MISDKKSPITYGYGDNLSVYFNQAPVLQVSTNGGFGGFGGGAAPAGRPTGRGTTTDPDIPQARPYRSTAGASASEAGRRAAAR